MKEEFKQLPLTDNEGQSRFELVFEKRLAFIEYELKDDTIALLHTEVDPALEGRGAGTAIIEKVLEEIEGRSLKLIPLCPFVVAYLKRHPEWERILVER